MLSLAMIAIAVAASAALGAALKWESVLIALKGKRVAILGAPVTGKTHLSAFLSTGSILDSYSQTTTVTRTRARRFALRELSLKIKRSYDLPGSRDAYLQWQALATEADLVLYLTRADLLFKGDPEAETRFIEDIQKIAEWLSLRRKAPRARFFLIGTHADLDPKFTLLGEMSGSYKDSFCRLPLLSTLLSQTSLVDYDHIVVGSMHTLEGTERLVYEIFKNL